MNKKNFFTSRGKKIGIFVSFLVPLIVLFRPIFSHLSLSAGDAPYFFNSFSWFLSEPHAWTTRGFSLGGLNQFIWIWPYMSLISLIEKTLLLSSPLLIRIFFYIPALVLAPLGAYRLTRYYGFSSRGAYFASLLSVFNTYFLTIFDGGQVGILLAYAIFPWAFISSSQFLNHTKATRFEYLRAIMWLCALTMADPRIALICLFVIFLLNAKFKKICLLILPWLLINSYWIYPLLFLSQQSTFAGIEIQTTSFLNGLFLYAPHWYENIYGVVTYPTILFSIFLLLIAANLFAKGRTNKKLLFVFLVLVFLIKGTTNPFGGVYAFIQKLPFGSAFRDSTKFFVPAIYLSGVLVSASIDVLTKKIGSRWVIVMLYVLFLLPVYPAIGGKMNFILSGHETNSELPSINQYIIKNVDADRTAWFPERDPRGVETSIHEGLDAKNLTDLRFFAQLNTGTEDRFNFLNRPEAEWWFDLLNIRNLIFTQNPRQVDLTKNEQEDQIRRSNLLPTLTYLEKVQDLTGAYKNSSYLPRAFGVEKALVIIGSDNVYNKLSLRNSEFKPYNHAFLFVEDGKWSPQTLEDYATSSAIIVNNSSDKNALTMSFLQSSFRSAQDAERNQFATFTTQEYLRFKYELLVRKFIFDDFDFNKGIAFSSEKSEEMEFRIPIEKSGDYAVSVRTMTENSKPGLQLTIDQKKVLTTAPSDQFTWNIEKIYLEAGAHTFLVKNNEGLQIFNIISVVPYDDFLSAQNKAHNITKNFLVVTPETISASILKQSWQSIDMEASGTSKYILNPSSNINWIVWTNNFDNKWLLSRDFLTYPSLPSYSAVNTFYKRPEWSQMTLEYQGQESVRFGIYLSLVSILIIIIIFLWI